LTFQKTVSVWMLRSVQKNQIQASVIVYAIVFTIHCLLRLLEWEWEGKWKNEEL